jgi:hypothetical protein
MFFFLCTSADALREVGRAVYSMNHLPDLSRTLGQLHQSFGRGGSSRARCREVASAAIFASLFCAFFYFCALNTATITRVDRYNKGALSSDEYAAAVKRVAAVLKH